jgi:Flp pilus assembly protein TadB
MIGKFMRILFPGKVINRLQRALTQLGVRERADELLTWSLAGGISLLLLGIPFLGGLQLVLYGIVCISVPVGVSYLYPLYKASRRRKGIEDALPGTLFQAASMASFVSMEEVIRSLADGNDKELANEFRKACMQIDRGFPVKEALDDIARRNDSRILSRAMHLLKVGYSTGADISNALKEAAEDINETAEVIRDRNASVTIEKYTLLLAGGIIVPLILGTLISLVLSLNLHGLQELGMGMDAATKEKILENSILGDQVYLVIYAVLASIFVAYQENANERALLYGSVLVPVSLLLFNLAMQMNFLSM